MNIQKGRQYPAGQTYVEQMLAAVKQAVNQLASQSVQLSSTVQPQQTTQSIEISTIRNAASSAPSSLPLSGAPPEQRSDRRRRGQPGRRRRAPAPRRIPGSALGCQTDSACVCRTALRIIVSPVYTKTRHFAPSLVSTTPNSRSRQPVSYANTASACGIMLLFLLPCAPPERVAP